MVEYRMLLLECDHIYAYVNVYTGMCLVIQ
jgi:hypothetical protein